MNRIYWDGDHIGVFTRTVESETHHHAMLQLFLGLEGPVSMMVGGRTITAECIIIGQDVPHDIATNSMYHFMYLISPTSELVSQINARLNSEGYWISEDRDLKALIDVGRMLTHNSDESTYHEFVDKLYDNCNFIHQERMYDERIEQTLAFIDSCDCFDHRLENYAEKLSLSSSRLSHLFKEEVGVSLKSYLVLHQVRMAFEAIYSGENISEAALNAGFNTPSHFASTVKRMMGTPASLSIKDSVFLKVKHPTHSI